MFIIYYFQAACYEKQSAYNILLFVFYQRGNTYFFAECFFKAHVKRYT